MATNFTPPYQFSSITANRLRSYCFIMFTIMIFVSSCTKIDLSNTTLHEDNQPVTSSFYGNTETADPIALKVMAKIQSINTSKDWIPNFTKTKGFPIWNKSVILELKKSVASFAASSNANSDTILFVPLVLQDSTSINGYLKILVNDSISLSYRLAEHYVLYPLQNNGFSPRAEFVMRMITINKLVFGHTKYEILDSNIIKHNGENVRFVTLGNHSNNSNVLAPVTYCQPVIWEWNSCSGTPNNFSNTSGGCWHEYNYNYCYTLLEDDGWWPPTGNGNGSTGSGTGSSGPGGPGGSGGNSGGSNPPCTTCGNPPRGWVVYEDPIPEPEPCARAELKSRNLDTLYNSSAADSMLASIPNLATETNEKGFVIYRKYEMDPYVAFDTTFTGYSVSQMYTGTDSNIVMDPIPPNRTVIACVFHTHPPRGYAAQSAIDIYKLIENTLANEYTVVGNIVRAANGSEYGITISDYNKASAFLGTKSNFLSGVDWNETSMIGKAFEKAKQHFLDLYKTNSNKLNLAYEMAMASVLTEFNTGITLSKKNAQGKFRPLLVRRVPQPLNPQQSYYLHYCE